LEAGQIKNCNYEALSEEVRYSLLVYLLNNILPLLGDYLPSKRHHSKSIDLSKSNERIINNSLNRIKSISHLGVSNKETLSNLPRLFGDEKMAREKLKFSILGNCKLNQF
jgi:hypothetical protein